MQEELPTLKEETPKPACTNCDKKMPRKGEFCPHCGQKRFDGRVSMADLIGRFLRNLIHLDSKFVKMVWHLFIPGKVTEEYFKGRIKRYPHPVQFFFVVMFFFLLCMNHLYTKQNKGVLKFSVNSQDTTAVATREDTLANILNEKGIEWAFSRYATGLELADKYQALPDSLHSDTAQKAIKRISEEYLSILSGSLSRVPDAADIKVDSMPFSMGTYQIKVATQDVVQLTADELLAKYQITRWQDRLLIKQGLKTLRDTKGLMRSYIGSLTWTILALTGFLAGILWLLWRRRRSYYVEHFIFLLHYVSAALLAATLLLALHSWVFAVPGGWYGIFFIWAGIALFLAMRRFYGGSMIGVLVRQIVFSMAGLLGFIVFFFGGMILVLAFY